MAEKPEDLSLPQAVVGRIINDALPSNTNVSGEARKAIAKTASVFVLFTTATAAAIAQKAGRKTMNGNDVLEAIVEMEFAHFREPLERSLEHFRETQIKKKKPANKKSETTPAATSSSPSSKKSKNSEQVVNISDSD